MRRAIYEDDVIKLLDKGWKSGVYPVASNIHALPSAQPEPRWIPVTERLPKKYGNYLITTGEEEIDLGLYDPDRPGSWSACDAKGFHWVVDVVAWMPLPEPYREEGGE